MKFPMLMQRWLAPRNVYQRSPFWIVLCSVLATVLLAIGLLTALAVAPPDYQQGNGFRIIYIHVPSAFFSLSLYAAMAVAAFIYLIWRIKIMAMFMRAICPVGACITLLALLSGSIWGKPMWGTWWVWDARLTSELLLLFLYLGIILLQQSIRDRDVASRIGAILILIGSIDLPIIHFSVNWWNTLHQGASLSLLHKPSIAPSMLYPLLIMLAGFAAYLIALVLYRLRTEIMRWEHGSAWLTLKH